MQCAQAQKLWLSILCFCSSVSFQQGHLRESCWTKVSLINFIAIHLHFLKRRMFYLLQTKLQSPIPCGNKFQLCLAQQHLPSTFWMEVPFSTEFCGLVVRNLMQSRSVVTMFIMCRTNIDLLSQYSMAIKTDRPQKTTLTVDEPNLVWLLKCVSLGKLYVLR